METIYNQVLYGLLAAAASGLFGSATALVPKGFAYLVERARSIKNTELRDTVEAVLTGLEAVVNTVVTSTQQTTVDALKAASQTGKLTKEQGAEVKARVVAEINAILGDEAKNILVRNFGNLDALISHLIEEAVFHLPNSAAGTQIRSR